MTDLTPPQETRSDKSHAAGKLATIGAAGLIATAGGLGAAVAAFGMQALVELVFRNPIEKRNEEWAQRVATVLETLEKREPGKSAAEVLRDLQANPEFMTTLQRASIYAVRTHQTEKIDALKNAVLNAALPGAPEADLQALYLQLIDQLSPSQMRILAFFTDPVKTLVGQGRYHLLPRRLRKMSPLAAARVAFPELEERAPLWFNFIRALEREDLIEGVLRENPESGFYDGLKPQATSLGRGFLEFVTGVEREPTISVAAGVASVNLVAELGSRSRQRTGVFEARPLRMQKMTGGQSIVESIGILFPREAANRPALNGNPPDLVDVRISITDGAHFDVFAFPAPSRFESHHSKFRSRSNMVTRSVEQIIQALGMLATRSSGLSKSSFRSIIPIQPAFNGSHQSVSRLPADRAKYRVEAGYEPAYQGRPMSLNCDRLLRRDSIGITSWLK
ncbi:MAG: hypothetical protein WEE89_12445 [Gemmatimonadota bacterium]